MPYSPALAKLLNHVRRNTDGSLVLSDLSPLQAIELQKIMDGERLLAHGTERLWRPGGGVAPTYLTPSLGHAYYYADPALLSKTPRWRGRPKLHLFQPRDPSVLDTAPVKEDHEAWRHIIHPLRSQGEEGVPMYNADEVLSQPLWRLKNVGDTALDLRTWEEMPTFVDQYVVPSPLDWLDKLFERRARGGLI